METAKELKIEEDESNARTPQQIRDEEGLKLILSPGEMLPWKSIWFVVEKVERDRVVLRPKETTSGFQKAKASEKKA